MLIHSALFFFFFFNDTATTEIYTLSLHDALPICELQALTAEGVVQRLGGHSDLARAHHLARDRKSTRLNSSHANISYAVFCLKKKKKAARSVVLQHNPGSHGRSLRASAEVIAQYP